MDSHFKSKKWGKTSGIIESPYQLQCAKDFIYKFGIENFHLYIRDNGNKKQNEQFLSLLQDVSDKNYTIFKAYSNGLKRLYQFPLFLIRVLFILVFSKHVIIGDLRGFFVRHFYRLKFWDRKTVIVDDGLYLLFHIEKLSERKFWVFSNLPVDSLSKNTGLTYVKREGELVQPSKFGESCFIGTKLSEIGFINESEYIERVRHAREKFGHLIYIPHREECELKLEKIANLDVQVKKIGVPIEKYLSDNEKSYKNFITYYSTAIFNLYESGHKSNFYWIEFDLDHLPEENKLAIMKCYELFDICGFKRLEI